MIKLKTKHLILNTPTLADLSALYDFEIRNKKHLERWESVSSKTGRPLKEEIENRLKLWIVEFEDKKSVRWLIKPQNNVNKIIGFCNFTQIFYGPFQACYLGYKIDYEYEGKGLMLEALEASIRYAFENLSLHRIMANYIPINTKSAKLLCRLGFEIEGFAKSYLQINDKWEDHVLTALSKEQWQQNPTTLLSNKLTKSDDVNFREVKVCDVPGLLNLMDQLGYPIAEDIMKDNIQKYLFLKNQRTWVAEKAGQIVGCIAVALTHYFHRPASFLRVIALIVDKQHRRLGIGKDLLSIAEKFALQHECSHIELTSGVHRAELGSHDFYHSMGYIELNNTKKYLAKKL